MTICKSSGRSWKRRRESVKEKDVGVYLEHQKPFTWTQDLYIKPEAKPGAQHLRFTIHVEVCNESTCQFGDHEFDVPFTIIDAPVVAADARPGGAAQGHQAAG